MKPDRKVAVGTTLGVPLAVVIVWMLQAFAKVEVPPEVATALGALLTGVLAYVVPNPPRDGGGT